MEDANNHIFLKHFLCLMRFIYVVFILLLALVTSAQCQQTAEDWFNSGLALANQGMYEEAIKAYDQAILLEPNNAGLRIIKGDALCNIGKYDEAITAYDKAISIDFNNVDAWNGKAWALNSKGKYNEALMACDIAIKRNPKHVQAWINKSWALKALGRTSEADAIFSRAKELGYKG
jgi:tetratricopeptide (TPR) repeat protein